MDPEDLRFADLAVAQGYCSREKVDECISILRRMVEANVTPLPRLGEILLQKGYLSPAQVHSSMTVAAGKKTATRVREVALPAEAARAERDAANVFGNSIKVERIGAGGMGEVWKGWDRPLGRWVALKFLHQHDPDQVARFRREAQTAAALNHPNIAGIYEVGEAHGKPYLAMQFIQGQTLQTFPRSDVRRLAGLIRDAARAVHHAHQKGVIHRDLKPANLMVEGDRVFVMDFGLAKPTAVDSSLSHSGSILGTPAYMPPEQARGGVVSPASDVYSLGATLYELLANRPPFEGADVYSVLRKVMEDDPLPPRKVRPAIDRDLETIVLKCLEKDPGRRYATAEELAGDLERWLKGEAILAHPPSTAYKVRKFIARRKGPVAVGAAGLAAVVATLALLVPRWLEDRSLKELGPLRTQIAVVREWVRQPFRKPEEIRQALEAEIQSVSEHLVRHPRQSQAYFVRAQARFYLGDLAEAEKDTREAIRLNPDFLPAWTLLGSIRIEEYAGLRATDLYDPILAPDDLTRRTLDEAREALRRGRARGGSRSEIEAWGLSRTRDDTVAETLAEAMKLQYIDGRTPEALVLLEESHRKAPSEEYCLWSARWSPDVKTQIVWTRQALDLAPRYAPAHVERGHRAAQALELAQAVRFYGDAIECNPRSTSARVMRGLAQGKLGNLGAAIADFTEALKLDPRHAVSLIYRSAARSQEKDFKGAVEDATRALEIHPDSAGALINRSLARRSLRDAAGARADLDRVLQLHPKLSIGWINRAGLRREIGDAPGALEDLSKAIEIDARWDAYAFRGTLRHRAGDLTGADEDLTRAIGIVNPRTQAAALADLYGERSSVRVQQGKFEEAEADATRGIEAAPGFPGPLVARAIARQNRGDAAGAIEDSTKALALRPGVPEAYLARSYALGSLRKFGEAAADAEKAIELLPEGHPQRALAAQWLEAYRAKRVP
jgi:tetratricopeptide (TPR) repeat protein/predicted Ser/Thr protein kinase